MIKVSLWTMELPFPQDTISVIIFFKIPFASFFFPSSSSSELPRSICMGFGFLVSFLVKKKKKQPNPKDIYIFLSLHTMCLFNFFSEDLSSLLDLSKLILLS